MDKTIMDIPASMLAARVAQYGPVDAISLDRIPVPEPGPGEVLIKVSAAGVGPWDAWIRAGKSALPQPLPLTLGADLSGEVVRVGEGSSSPAAGDLVFGVTNPRFVGAQAEYAVCQSRSVQRKPAGLGHIEAAAIPVVAVTAWSMVFDYGAIQLGQRVLVHGAAGNVGAYAVQMAKAAGAQVVATCFSADVARVEALGADDVIDVSVEPFAGRVKYADVVLDTVGGVTQTASFDILVPGGRLVSSVSPPDQALAAEHRVKADFFLVDVTAERLAHVAGLVETRKLHVAIGEILPLRSVRRAHEMLAGAPHRPGKIVLEVGTETTD
ncbi:quinone oxidoreductase [Youhaiella tibetensis]|nr:NADP-dependent oxidoreductase [Youhaiella tibetensis]GGF17795.1 quinone oxidoreductase [Youhaiella tibetensis]